MNRTNPILIFQFESLNETNSRLFNVDREDSLPLLFPWG